MAMACISSSWLPSTFVGSPCKKNEMAFFPRNVSSPHVRQTWWWTANAVGLSLEEERAGPADFLGRSQDLRKGNPMRDPKVRPKSATELIRSDQHYLSRKEQNSLL